MPVWIHSIAGEWTDDGVSLFAEILSFFFTWHLKRALVSSCSRDALSQSLYLATLGGYLLSTVQKESQHTGQRNGTEKEILLSLYGCIKWQFCGHSRLSVEGLEPGPRFLRLVITRLLFFFSDTSPGHPTCALSTKNSFAVRTGCTLVWAGDVQTL